jgi:hypothetical protein
MEDFLWWGYDGDVVFYTWPACYSQRMQSGQTSVGVWQIGMRVEISFGSGLVCRGMVGVKIQDSWIKRIIKSCRVYVVNLQIFAYSI